MTYGSLFSGIGGIDLGLARAGWECKWMVENDPYCNQILQKHWPDVKRYGDIRSLGGSELERVDCIAGGFPCQDLSQAGKRAGIEGARSGLWFEFARLIGVVRPRYVLIENVPGLLVPGAMRRVVGELARLGYVGCWRSLRASEFGASHPSAVTHWPTPIVDRATYRGAKAEYNEPTLHGMAINWPTANTRDASSAARHTTETDNLRREDGRMAWPAIWPTATLGDGKASGSAGYSTESGRAEGTTLTDAIRMWATPNAHDQTGARGKGFELTDRHYHPHDLCSMVDTWATPNAHDGRRPGSDATSTQGANLKRDAEAWPTPSARDWKSGQASEETFTGNARPLNEHAERWPTFTNSMATMQDMEQARYAGNGGKRPKYSECHSLPAPPIPDGPVSSGSGQTSRRHWPTASASVANDGETLETWEARRQLNLAKGYNGNGQGTPLTIAAVGWNQEKQTRRLNPRFVEWLLGFPVTWSER